MPSHLKALVVSGVATARCVLAGMYPARNQAPKHHLINVVDEKDCQIKLADTLSKV